MSRINVLYFTADYPPMVGGITMHTARLVKAVAGSNEVGQVQVVVLRGNNRGVEAQGNISVVRDTHGSLFSVFVRVCRYCFRFRKFDVFHTTNVFPVGFFVVLIGKYLLHKPVVVTFYGTDVLTSTGGILTRAAKGFVLRHASQAIAFSYAIRDLATKKYRVALGRFPVIYTPLDFTPTIVASDLRVRYGAAKDDFVVLFVGNLIKRKGAELAIRALHMINDSTVKLVIIGDGSERKNLERVVAELNLGDRVVLAGRVDAAPYYSIASAFTMPSFFERNTDDIEGLGIVFLEAQAAGVPVIGTRSGGIPEAIDEGKSGFIIPENDVTALAAAIRTLRADPALCERMGAHGKVFVREKFSTERSREEHIRLYRAAMTEF